MKFSNLNPRKVHPILSCTQQNIMPIPDMATTEWRDPSTGKEHRALILRDNKGRQIMIQYPADDSAYKLDLDPMRLVISIFLDMATTSKTSEARDLLSKYGVQIQLPGESVP